MSFAQLPAELICSILEFCASKDVQHARRSLIYVTRVALPCVAAIAFEVFEIGDILDIHDAIPKFDGLYPLRLRYARHIITTLVLSPSTVSGMQELASTSGLPRSYYSHITELSCPDSLAEPLFFGIPSLRPHRLSWLGKASEHHSFAAIQPPLRITHYHLITTLDLVKESLTDLPLVTHVIFEPLVWYNIPEIITALDWILSLPRIQWVRLIVSRRRQGHSPGRSLYYGRSGSRDELDRLIRDERVCSAYDERMFWRRTLEDVETRRDQSVWTLFLKGMHVKRVVYGDYS